MSAVQQHTVDHRKLFHGSTSAAYRRVFVSHSSMMTLAATYRTTLDCLLCTTPVPSGTQMFRQLKMLQCCALNTPFLARFLRTLSLSIPLNTLLRLSYDRSQILTRNTGTSLSSSTRRIDRMPILSANYSSLGTRPYRSISAAWHIPMIEYLEFVHLPRLSMFLIDPCVWSPGY